MTVGPGDSPSRLPQKAWLAACAAILIVAALLRFSCLTQKPLHNDEGVNGFFLTLLFRSGSYRYDPANYHGPTLYYLALIVTEVNRLLHGKAALSTFAIRCVPAICGTAIVWLILALRRNLGDLGALGAAALLAVSPGAVYFSRDFIHETVFVFFTLAAVVAALRYREKGRPVYLLLASASAALLFATKETAFISAVVVALAWGCAGAWISIVGHFCANFKNDDLWHIPSPQLPVAQKKLLLYAAAAALFVAIWVSLYSSFFTNFPQGVYDSVRTFRYWAKTGIHSGYVSDFATYFRWLAKEELPLAVMGALGFLLALWKRRSRFALFTGFWTAGMLAAYSLIPYKTPWLTLNITLPCALVAGYAVEEMRQARMLLALSLAGCVIFSSYQAVDLSFVRYDDDSICYVYGQTRRSFLTLLNEVCRVASINGSGYQTPILITAREYWPLPWYLRDYEQCAYDHAGIPDQEAIVITRKDQNPELRGIISDRYDYVGVYDLRPGIILELFVRRDLKR